MEVAPKGQEVYFDFKKGDFTIRVHSSVFLGVSRDCGQDAIRVSVVFEAEGKTHGIRRFPRVTRQENWQTHLKSRVLAAFEYINAIKRCPRCLSPLAHRKAAKTNSKFLGCIRYPLCRYTEDLT